MFTFFLNSNFKMLESASQQEIIKDDHANGTSSDLICSPSQVDSLIYGILRMMEQAVYISGVFQAVSICHK